MSPNDAQDYSSNNHVDDASRIGVLSSVTKSHSSNRKLMNGCSFTVEKLDLRNFSNSSENRIIEVEEPVETPAVGGKTSPKPLTNSTQIASSDHVSHLNIKASRESNSSDSNPESGSSHEAAPSLNPQVADVKQFAPNYDDLHGYPE